MTATLVFDLDGTLVDSRPDLIGTLSWLFVEEGMKPIDLDHASRLIGAGMKPMIQRALADEGRYDDAELERVYARYVTAYRARLTLETRPYPGVIAALERFSARGYRLAVCTNKIEELAMQLLTELDMTKHFAWISGADTYDAKKPDGRHILNTVRDAGGEGQPALMVGDSATDINAARNAGVPVIGYLGGYTEIPLHELAPDRIIGHYDEFDEAALSLLGM
jgi:phosphoglycolate phosphatase